jgi:hypothetical protein
MKSLFGNPKVKTQASGFFSMPKPYQDLYNSVIGNMNTGLGGISDEMFDPSQGQTAGAFGQLMQGFTPTTETLGQDINMLMNPFNDSVIGLMNREAQGQNSVLNQALNRSGQMGSNRAILGASDIEQNRQNNIGSMQQGQYNNALSQILNNLVPQRQSDAMGALGVGMQANQAPLQALLAQGGLLGGLPTSFGTQGQAQSSGGGTNWGNVIGTAASIFSKSDIRLKQDITPVGFEQGLPVYTFRYKDGYGLPSDKTYHGVLAQEVMEVMPEAVQTIDGYLAVNYDMIGIEMKEVAHAV